MSGHKKVQRIVVFTALFTLIPTAYAQESKYENRVTGATGKVDSQSPVGAYLSINYQF